LNRLKENRPIWIIPVYGIFYLISFFCLEQRKVTLHIIHSTLDDYIPFCEYFIVPYVLWFGFIGVTLWYFAFRCHDRKEYDQLIGALGTGMTVFLITSYLYPNGHDLRPELSDGNLFIQAVKILYQMDTPTNILPSIHVFNTIACAVALCKNREIQKNRWIVWGTKVLSVLIILSTMFLKQHTVLDVVLGLLLYGVCYQVFYKWEVVSCSATFYATNRSFPVKRKSATRVSTAGYAKHWKRISDNYPDSV
jgi:membrane-associated phospholipid phosphatase